jgi:hypothetical protein
MPDTDTAELEVAFTDLDTRRAEEELRTRAAIAAKLPMMVPTTADFALPAPVQVLRDVADILAGSFSVPGQFRGKPEACMALAYAAANWRMDPVAVASKAYLVKGKDGVERVAWEAQLIISLIRLRAPITSEGLEIDFYGEGTARYCRVRAKMRGSNKWCEVISPTIAQVAVKNSPLWFSDPDQQLAYYTQRAWARRWCPEIILGVYSKDEMVDVSAVDITPARDPDAEDEALPEVEVTVDGEEETPATEPDPEPSGGADAAKAAVAKAAKAKGDGKEPDDMPELREWLAGVQRQCLEEKDPKAVIDIWDGARKDKRMGRIKAYSPDLNRTAYQAIVAHVETLKAPPAEGDGFPGDKP